MLDVEHVLVRGAVRTAFLFEGVSVQVEHVNLIEGTHQMPAHAAEGGVIQVRVIRDHAHHALAGLGDLPLGKAQEFNVVVLEPLGVLLAQGLSVHVFIVLDQAADPRTFIGRVAGVRGISQDHQDGHFALDLAGPVGLLGEGSEPGELAFLQLLQLLLLLY